MGASRLASERGVEMGHRGLASVASRLSQCVPGGREGGGIGPKAFVSSSSQQAPSEVEVMPEEDVVVAVTLSFLLGRRARAGIAA